ncbi:ATP-binding protein [Gordonia sp. OPL2]|uniref:ATP-binding protein n=1 Tax=Gordonia sp. OPL2 TaxID=2486274 RepID=UPI001654FFCA|nr:AAA family ATPase [Gordonia sp. OPL2]
MRSGSFGAWPGRRDDLVTVEDPAMRIHRLRLRDYRGIADRDVRFAERGVTVVEGANEAGKSSMIEALDLLLHTRADSKSAKVRDIMPSGRDVGSEVEVEMTCGPWHVTYAKRFNRQPSTTLTVHAPRAEQVSGRDAHERVLEILGAHADLALFRALRLLQSGDPALGALTDSSALARALDRAADGGSRPGDAPTGDPDADDPADHALIDAVLTEYRRYRTPGQGRPTGELSAALAAVDDAQARRDQLVAARDAVEADAGRLRETLDRRAEVERATELRAVERDELAVVWEQVERLQTAMASADSEVRHLLTAVQLARRDVAERQRTKSEIDSRTRDSDRLAEIVERHRATATAAAADVAALSDELRGARDRCEQVRTELAAAHIAHRALRERRELHDLTALLEHLDDLAARRDELSAESASNSVDRAAVDAAAELGRRRADAQARVDAAAARFTVSPTGTTPVRVDGAVVDGESEHVALADSVIEVDGIVRVQVHRTAGSERPVEQLAAVDADIAEYCTRHGLSSLADHHDRAQRRVETTHALRAVRERMADLCGGRDPSMLAARRDELRARLDESESIASEGPETDEGVDLSATIDDLTIAERELGGLVMRAELAVTQRLSAERESTAQADAMCAERSRVVASLEELTRRRDELAGELDDVQAQETVDLAEQRLEQAREQRGRVAADLDALDVADIEMRRARVAADLERLRREHADTDRTATELRTRIELYRDESRLDDLQEASAGLRAAREALARVRRRADAATLLWQTLTEKRQLTRVRYADPFARRLAELGSHVFGDGVRFDVDEKLDVVSRTVDGVTVRHDALSGGAREQIGVLTRLACATLVDEADGVPVLVDDALGYSDPRRLAAMGEVLTAAGRDAQVIVLTCSPDRYRGVEGATVVAV